jgi:hypothetical protein
LTTEATVETRHHDQWTDADWEGLLYAIEYKQCTPVLGAGACAGVLPLGRDIATSWAAQYDYPFQDTENLPRVAQYVAIQGGPNTPKFRLKKEFATYGFPDFNDPNEPHRLVADLRLPVYVTTNYDDFIMQALARGDPPRQPKREVCQWFKLRGRNKLEVDIGFQPTPEKPLVFHLHGSLEIVDSMVLTEDDYLEFLVCVSEEENLIPPCVSEVFTSSSLLFMGYSLDDMNFKVLFRKLSSYMRRNQSERHVSVQLAPKPNESTAEFIARARKQRDYLERHFGLQKVKVYWGTCQEFARELRAKWEAFGGGR